MSLPLSVSNHEFQRVINLIPCLYLASVFLGQGISFGPVYFFHILSFLMMIFIISEHKNLRMFLQQNFTYYSFLIGIFAFFTFSYLLNFQNHPAPLVQYYMCLSVLFFTPLACEYTPRSQLLKLIVILISAHLILSTLETFNLIRWPLSPYSQWKDIFLKTARQDYSFKDIEGSAFAPATSFFWNPNNSAFVTLTILPFLELIQQKWVRRSSQALCMIIIFFSKSRSVLLLSLILGFYFLCKVLLRNKILLIPLLCAMFFLMVYFNNITDSLALSFQVFRGFIEGLYHVFEHFFFNTTFDDLKVIPQVRERMVFTKVALDHYFKSPLTGNGIGYLYDKFFPYEGRVLELASIHNSYIELLVELGLIGISALAYYFVYLYRKIASAENLRTYLITSFALALSAIPVLSTSRYFLYFYGLMGVMYYFSTINNSQKNGNH